MIQKNLKPRRSIEPTGGVIIHNLRRGSLGFPGLQNNINLISIHNQNEVKDISSMRAISDPTKEKNQRNKQHTKLKKIFGNGLASLFEKKRQKVKQNIDHGKEMQRQKAKITNTIKASNQLTPTERIQKAYRHFFDALNMRQARNDVELKPRQLIKVLYLTQCHPFFQMFCLILSFCYMALTFFEPSNRYDTVFEISEVEFILEITILAFMWLDLILETIHLQFDKDKNFREKYIHNKVYLFKLFLQTILLIDAVHFYSYYQTDALRFARILRPCIILYLTITCKRTAKSIIMSTKQIIQLILFFLIMTLFWSIVALRVIGNLDGQVEYDPLRSNFDNLATSFTVLYMLTSPDDYPECMIPALEYSQYYLVFFLSYIILYLLLFVPIPVAIVFDAYRENRCKLVIMDRLKQREALLACFIALDYEEKKFINERIFTQFMEEVCLHKKYLTKQIHRLFKLLDKNNNQAIVTITNSIFKSINEFFDLVDLIEGDPTFSIPIIKDSQLWDLLRKVFNKYLKIKIIANSLYFEIFMFNVVIFNCGVVFAAMLVTDSETEAILDQIDDICLYLYIVEFGVKLIGFGITKYFQDDWNMQQILNKLLSFDFSMIIISLVSSFVQNVISILKSAKALKSSKILRLTKVSRLVRAFKTIRTIKVLNFLVIGADTLIQVKVMVQRIILCIPLIFKLIPIILLILYIWGVIGIEQWNTNTFQYREDSPYQQGNYADFTSFGGAILILLQISFQAQWSDILFDYVYKFNAFYGVVIYFISFHMLIQLIFLSLVKGIIWEVFMIVEQTSKQLEEQKEIQILNSQDHLYQGKALTETKSKLLINDLTQYNVPEHEEYENFLVNLSYGQVPSAVRQESPIPQKIQQAQYNDNLRKKTSMIPDPSPRFSQKNQIPHLEAERSIDVNSVSVDDNYKYQRKKPQNHHSINININTQNTFFVFGDQTIGPKQSSAPYPSPRVGVNVRKPSILKSGSEDKQCNRSSLKSKTNTQAKKSQAGLPRNQYKSFSQFNQSQLNENNQSCYSGSEGDLESDPEFFQELIVSKLKNISEIKQMLLQDQKNNLDYQIVDSDNEESVQWFTNSIMHAMLNDQKEYESKVKKFQTPKQLEEALQIQPGEKRQDQNYFFKKALLKETNFHRIKKLENDYFQTLYGNVYESFNEVDYDPLLKYQSFLLQNLDMMFRHNSQGYKSSLKLLTMIENNISGTLAGKGSLFKFIFRDSQENWFYLAQDENEDIVPIKAGSGPWQFQNFIPQEQIQVGLDFFQPSVDNEINQVLLEYFLSFKKITYSVNQNQAFQQFKALTTIMDLFLIQFAEQNEKYIQETVLQSLKKNGTQNHDNLTLKVTKIMVVLLKYSGDSQAEAKDRRFAIVQPENIGINDGNQFDKLKNLKIKTLKTQSHHEKERISEYTSLNLPFLIELLEGIKMILKLRCDNILIKISQFINEYGKNLQIQRKSIKPNKLQRNSNSQ